MQIIFVRAVILYIFVIINMRILGKRQLGELEASELAVTIILSELAAIPMQDTEIPLLYGLLPALTIMCVEFILNFTAMKSIRFRRVMWGKPSIIIQNGKVIQEELKKNRVTLDEICEVLRIQDITDISTVKYAILETSGQLSTILYAAKAPATPEQMSLTVDDGGLPVTVVSDGKFLSNNMKVRNVDKVWVESYLQQNGFPRARDIFLMTVDDMENVYVVEKDKPAG